ncbi:MAG: glycosyltransferase [Candidatus Omnitrophica bacterium]|nr:glycosyltransferase [Candidatus Omnitrophota bacterium]
MSEPFVSIIVPVYNAEKTIRKCIESLLNIDYMQYDILIIDDESTDKTKEILSEYKNRIHIIESQHSGPSRCRNIAAKDAKGDFIAFTDSDCIVDKDWITELLKGFVNQKVASVGGSQYSPEDETYFGNRVQDFFDITGFLGGYIKNKKREDIVEVQHNPSCNAIYRREVFLEIGSFDEKLWPCEDVDLDYRLKKKGFVFMYNPKAIVYHYRPQSFKQLSEMMYRYGVVQGILTRKYGFFRRIQIIPVFLIILLILIFTNLYWLIIPVAFYLYILVKLKSLINGSFVFSLSVLSTFFWIAGFFRGLVIFKK